MNEVQDAVSAALTSTGLITDGQARELLNIFEIGLGLGALRALPARKGPPYPKPPLQQPRPQRSNFQCLGCGAALPSRSALQCSYCLLPTRG